MNLQEIKEMFVGRINWSSYNVIIELVDSIEKQFDCKIEFAMCLIDKDNKMHKRVHRIEMDATSAFFHHNDPEYPDDWCGDYLSVDLANQWYRKSGIAYQLTAYTWVINNDGLREKEWHHEGISAIRDAILNTDRFISIGNIGEIFHYFKDINPDSSDLLHTALPQSQPLSVSSLYS